MRTPFVGPLRGAFRGAQLFAVIVAVGVSPTGALLVESRSRLASSTPRPDWTDAHRTLPWALRGLAVLLGAAFLLADGGVVP